MSYLLPFFLDERRYALKLDNVQRVISAVAVTSLPDAPANVLGVIDLHGALLPVLNARRRLGHANKMLHPDDVFIIVHSGKRLAALWVDRVEPVVAIDDRSVVSSASAVPGIAGVEGLVARGDGLVLIHNLDWLDRDDQAASDDSLSANR